MSTLLKLKKYANRRLYDTERSVYVTLSEVTDMIRKGRVVEVSDAKTQEDVTAFILTQIVMEEARNKNALLPVPLLHIIIRYGDTLLVEFFEKHLQQTLQIYLSQKRIFDEQFQRWLEMGFDFGEAARKTAETLNPFPSLLQEFFQKKSSDSNGSDPPS